jgi:hypothetical protein
LELPLPRNAQKRKTKLRGKSDARLVGSSNKGRRENKNDESDVHLQPQNKSSHSLHFIFIFVVFIDFVYRVFGRFVTRGVQKHGGGGESGLIKKKNWAFFFPLPRLFSSILFIAFLVVS